MAAKQEKAEDDWSRVLPLRISPTSNFPNFARSPIPSGRPSYHLTGRLSHPLPLPFLLPINTSSGLCWPGSFFSHHESRSARQMSVLQLLPGCLRRGPSRASSPVPPVAALVKQQAETAQWLGVGVKIPVPDLAGDEAG